ncbi:hypothetical protein ACT7DM_30920 [Bacillus cereus]
MFENKASAAGSTSSWENIDHISKGWRIRLDNPSPGGKYHVHVYNKKVEMAVENVDGTASHGQTFNSCLSPKVSAKIRQTKLYQKRCENAKKQKMLVIKVEKKENSC